MKLLVRHWLLIILAVVFVIYCLFQARFLILGPQVSITSHRDGMVVTSPSVTLEGTARNTAWLNLNGRQIFTDEGGHWSEKLILALGPSIMTVRARDRFGRESTKSITLILN
jgi:hypothetical protein